MMTGANGPCLGEAESQADGDNMARVCDSLLNVTLDMIRLSEQGSKVSHKLLQTVYSGDLH